MAKVKFRYNFDRLFEDNFIAKDVYHYICDEKLKNNNYLCRKESQDTEFVIDVLAFELTQQIFKKLRPEEYLMFRDNMCYIGTIGTGKLEQIYWHCWDTKIDGVRDLSMKQFRQIYRKNPDRLYICNVHYGDFISVSDYLAQMEFPDINDFTPDEKYLIIKEN